jgi:hypothetical protein
VNSKNYAEHRGDEVVVLLPLLALFGAVVGIGFWKKRRHRHEKHRGHDGRECGHFTHGHACHCGDSGHGHSGRSDHHESRGREQGPRRRGFDPMRILDKRFAAGEIDEDEYLHRRKVLKENA